MNNVKVFTELWQFYSSFLKANKDVLNDEKIEDMAIECRDKFIRDTCKITKHRFANIELAEVYNVVDSFLKTNKSF